MKLNNERLPGKNTKLLGGTTPLYSLILESLLDVPSVDEVYVFCSAERFDGLPDGVEYLRRSEELDSTTTRINEVMSSFQSSVDADVYVLAHATAPFIRPKTIDTMVNNVRGGFCDSAIAVTASQEFLWQDNSPVNYDPADIPRTQDIKPVFIETTGAYVYTRAVGALGRRVGDRPCLVEVSKVEAIDINEPTDWIIADALFRSGVHGSTMMGDN